MKFKVNKVNFILPPLSELRETDYQRIEKGLEIIVEGINYDRVKGYTCKGEKVFKERF